MILMDWADLYNVLYKNFSINAAANKIDCFKKFIKNNYYSNYNKKNKLFDKEIIDLSNIFYKQNI